MLRHVSTRTRSALLVAAILMIQRLIYSVARRWTVMVGGLVTAWLGAAFVAPLLEARAAPGWASVIYAINSPFCHQRDDRSFYIVGEKMACCERCAAIYAGLLVFALCYGRLRRQFSVFPWTGFVAACIPAGLDALSQAVGLRESTPILRVVTGGLLGVGVGWLLLPYLDAGFADIRAQLERRFARLAAEGRTHPLPDTTPAAPG